MWTESTSTPSGARTEPFWRRFAHRLPTSDNTAARASIQSESITGVPFAKHWMHSAMVSYEGEKMSKSLGNLVFVSDLLEVADHRAIRLALLRHHYRAGFEWYDSDLEEGTALLHRLLAAAAAPTGVDPTPFAAREP